MSKSLKITLFAVSIFVGLLILVAAALLFFVDANAYKPRLEAAASRVLGMEVRAGGKLGVGLSAGLLITLEDVHIRNQAAEIASASEAQLGIDLLPLLERKVRIGKIVLKQPRISIERGRDGKFNFEKPEAAGKSSHALTLPRVTIVDGTLQYADKASGGKFEARNCNLDVDRLWFSGGESPDPMKNLSFAAELACGEIRTKALAVFDVKISVTGKNGIFDLKPVLMRVFGGQGSGSIRADFAGAVPLYQIHYSLSQFHIEEFLKTLSPQKSAEGLMDFSMNLSMRGKTVKEMKQALEGESSLRGEKLTLHGRDLDRDFSRYESSQNFNLVDVGAFFFAGPVGLAVTKGYSFASLFQGSGGRSEIRTFVSTWKVERGVAQAVDVAMATNQNRVALHGGLDFVNARYNHVTVALLDNRGCAKVRQKIRGSFQKPVVEQPNILKSLSGPAFELLKKGRELFPDGECAVFYAGSVTPLN